MRRAIRWDRRYAKPLSDGGATICEKHDFIAANHADPDMDYEIDLVVAQAKDDGQRMERRLQELGKECNNMEDYTADYDALVAENRRLRISQLRRMAECAERLTSNWLKMANLPWAARKIAKLERFKAACLAEIARLRGEV